MDRALDQVMQELDLTSAELEKTSERLAFLADYTETLKATINVMAERIAMLGYPNFLAFPDGKQGEIINEIATYYEKLDKKNYIPKHRKEK